MKRQEFKHAIVAVDVVIFTVRKDGVYVLLLELKEKPYEGKWALPGGLVLPNETVDDAAIRHLQDKARVKNVFLEQLYTFGDIDRDPRGRVISTAYYALVREDQVKTATSERYAGIEWKRANNLPKMAYDHETIVKMALERLKAKVGYTNIVYSLLPEKFTLTELQKVYEIILGKRLDKRNFRKKLQTTGIIKSLNMYTSGNTSRPAQMYSFIKRQPQIVEIL